MAIAINISYLKTKIILSNNTYLWFQMGKYTYRLKAETADIHDVKEWQQSSGE
jgi:hypothetical protein